MPTVDDLVTIVEQNTEVTLALAVAAVKNFAMECVDDEGERQPETGAGILLSLEKDPELAKYREMFGKGVGTTSPKNPRGDMMLDWEQLVSVLAPAAPSQSRRPPLSLGAGLPPRLPRPRLQPS